jgi:hypothetical protein
MSGWIAIFEYWCNQHLQTIASIASTADSAEWLLFASPDITELTCKSLSSQTE